MHRENPTTPDEGRAAQPPSGLALPPSPAGDAPAPLATTSQPPQAHASARTRTQQAPAAGLRALRRAIPTFRSRSVRHDSHTAYFRGKPRHLVASALLLTIAITLLMSIPFLPGQVDVEPGVPAPQPIFSPNYLRFESKVKTEEAREKARNDPANEVWARDTELVQAKRSILVNNLSAIDTLRLNASQDTPAPPRREPVFQGITLTQSLINMLVMLPDYSYQSWRDNAVLAMYDDNMRESRLASEADVAAARDALPDRLPEGLSPEQREAALAFVVPVLAVNMRLDEAQTTQRREEAAARVKPVIQEVMKGEAIVRQGEIVTPEAIEKMQEAGLLRREITYAAVAGTGTLVAMLMILLHLYIYRYTPQVWQRQRMVLLIALLILSTVVVARIFLPGHSLLPYLLPLAAVAMLVAVLISTNVAVLTTLVLSVLVSLVATGNNLALDLTLFYFISGLVGIFSLTRVERVGTFARAGVLISLAGFLTAVTLKVITNAPVDWSTLQSLALASVFNGVVAASLTYAAFSLLGTLFGITTPVQLMELAHPDQPVLRRLMREAPGTYHHSLVVSNLAERAAEMIGADALLTRVCAYYHDIGKVVKPYYFIDNQTGMKNVHDELDPRQSAAIIAAHVTDGLELGRKHRLPRRVLDAIPQHHGTMLIQYFYHKALKSDPNANPDDYRYAGPKPQTKENAILMLADGVEATVRAMAQAGALDKVPAANSDASESLGLYNDTASLPDDVIAHNVHRIINERIEDGQLDECDLTVRDIARIQEAFVSMLKGIYHPRVQYPGQPAAPVPAPALNPVAAQPGEAHLVTSPLANGHTNGLEASTPAPGAPAEVAPPVERTRL